MEITGALIGGDSAFGTYNSVGSGAFYINGTQQPYMFARSNWQTHGPTYNNINFAASRNWTGSTSTSGTYTTATIAPPTLQYTCGGVLLNLRGGELSGI